MIKSAAFSLFGAVILLASCTSDRQENPQGGAAQPSGGASQRAASPSPTEVPTPAAAGTEVVAQPTDRSPRPAGRAEASEASEASRVLPLKPGVYVLETSGCSAPANAGVRFYDGRGISGSATHSCRTLVRSHRGDTYLVEQSCIDTPSGDGPRTSESQTITVQDALTFTLATEDESARFRYCPVGELPEYLRQRMSQLSEGDAGT